MKSQDKSKGQIDHEKNVFGGYADSIEENFNKCYYDSIQQIVKSMEKDSLLVICQKLKHEVS